MLFGAGASPEHGEGKGMPDPERVVAWVCQLRTRLLLFKVFKCWVLTVEDSSADGGEGAHSYKRHVFSNFSGVCIISLGQALHLKLRHPAERKRLL